MKVYVIGTGMNGESTLTREAAAAIADSEVIIGAERMTAPYLSSGKTVLTTYKPTEIADYLNCSTASSAAVLLSGDTGFFSAAKRLLPLLEDHDVKTLCGISSAAYLCSLTGHSYEDMRFISLHGRSANIAINVRMNRYCFFLLGGEMTVGELCSRLCSYNLGGVRIFIGEDMGSDSEKITEGIASDFTSYENVSLCSLIVENPDCIKYIPSSMSDSAFIRGNVPMTKAVVRGSAVSSLEIERDSVCWDIGCGTGSVSVEMAFRCPAGTVYAFDKSAEAVELTKQNCMSHSCDNIIVREGVCPDLLEDVPAPDKVFIGGSSGNMLNIFRCITNKGSSPDIAVTAVSLETLEQACRCFEAFFYIYTVTQIAVTDTRKVGNHTMLTAQNPVFLIRGRKS